MSGVGNYSSAYGGGQALPVVYFDPLVYTKVPAASPPTTCSMTTPCSLHDYLNKKYGTIAALNNASTGWNSTYTSCGATGFGSCGTGVGYTYSWLNSGSGTPETLCTGTGSSTTCNHTLATGTATSAFSVQVILTPSGGSPQIIGGDCPQFSNGCGGSVGGGTILGPGIWKAGIAYPSGQVITDSNGNIEVLTTAGTPAGKSGNSTPAWPATCTGTQTTTDNVLTWKCLGTGISSGAITYATRVIAITLHNNLASGATYSVNYVADGWGLGNGLLDEDGRHSSWIGTDWVCGKSLPSFNNNGLYNVNDQIQDSTSGTWQMVTVSGISQSSGTPSFSATSGVLTTSGGVTFQSIGKGVCQSGGDFPAPNGNQILANDIVVSWESNFAAQYFSTWRTTFNTIYPSVMYGCADNLGTWQTPARAPVLQAANQYCDWAYDQMALMNTSIDPQSNLKFSFATQYFTKPMVLFETPVSRQSQSACGGNSPCDDTQVGRGADEYTIINTSLNTLSFNGTFQRAGYAHWGSHDFSGGQNANFGFKTGGLASWNASHVYKTPPSGDFNSYDFIIDSNGNMEQATTGGTSGSGSHPTWPATCTGTQTTNDNTVVWTCLGVWPVDNRLDGHENVSGTVACSPPNAAFNCGGQPANYPYNGTTMFGGAQNLSSGLALWFSSVAPFSTNGCAPGYLWC
jgi:hypothetical protein